MSPEPDSYSYLLIDSNLMVLWCVGLADPAFISRHKRLQAYDETDFGILSSIVDKAASIMISPNTATECSNLSRQLQSPMKEHVTAVFGDLLHHVVEVYAESKVVTGRREYIRLGLTDACLLHILDENPQASLLTVDMDLYLAAASSNLKATNFNHLRDQRRDFSIG